MTIPAAAADLLARADAVAARLLALVAAPKPDGLTEPDPGGGERWDAGQVWAHLVEFVPYWVEQIRGVAAAPGDGAPFGRTKSDAERIAAIERARDTPATVLHARLEAQLKLLHTLLVSLPAPAWERSGTHSTLGRMPMARMIDEFLVGHLEEHADQLDGLAATSINSA